MSDNVKKMSSSRSDSSKNMPITESLEDDGSEEESEISSFLDGRSMFLTGVSGFLGTVLLATVITYCPGIQKIYVLLRNKKGLEPMERLDKILKKKIFHNLWESNPDFSTKIVIVPGEISEDNLGISEQMMYELEENVSVVIHCAAVVNFSKPLGYMIKQNVIGTESIVKFCRRLKNLAVMTYVSTAYSSCNEFEIDEIVPLIDVPPKVFMEAARLGDEDKLLELSKTFVPPWPNTYTFSKAVCENFLKRDVKDIPLAIIRPSVIFSSWKGVLPGYVEEGFGFTDTCISIAKGFVRVLHCDSNKILDTIPVDTVVNTILMATNYVHKNKSKEPLIVNCVSGNLNPLKIGDIVSMMYNMQELYPIPNMYQKPNFRMRRNRIPYWISAAVNHHVPALVIDLASILMGKKPKMTKMYLFYESLMKKVNCYYLKEWHFVSENYEMLIRSQTSKDRQSFPIDIKDLTINDLSKGIRQNAPFYEWNRDKRGVFERMNIAYKRYVITESIKWMTITSTLVFFGSFIYWLCRLIFKM